MLEQGLFNPPGPRFKDGHLSVFRAGEEMPLVVEPERVEGPVCVRQRPVLGSFPEIEDLEH